MTQREAWQGSTRRDRLPTDWHKIRAHVLRRDPTCTCTGCPSCTPAGCPAPSTDVDHVVPIDDHSERNLRGLCAPCHLAKTGRDNADYNRRRAELKRRPAERHPGAR